MKDKMQKTLVSDALLSARGEQGGGRVQPLLLHAVPRQQRKRCRAPSCSLHVLFQLHVGRDKNIHLLHIRMSLEMHRYSQHSNYRAFCRGCRSAHAVTISHCPIALGSVSWQHLPALTEVRGESPYGTSRQAQCGEEAVSSVYFPTGAVKMRAE